MKYLNNFNIIADIQNSTVFLKSKDIFLALHHLKTAKCAITVNIYVALDM